ASLCLASSPSYIYPLSLHDALPIFPPWRGVARYWFSRRCGTSALPPGRSKSLSPAFPTPFLRFGHYRYPPRPIVPESGRHYGSRSEEHTSELQSRENLVCRLLLEKK